MKYRIQSDITFDNETNAVDLINHVESIKTGVYKAEQYTAVAIERTASKADYYDDLIDPIENESTVDFDASEATHTAGATASEYRVKVDVSFSIQQDAYDLLNHIESIKAQAVSNKTRNVRYFECCHDEIPLVKDGPYTYVDFTIGSQTHPLGA